MESDQDYAVMDGRRIYYEIAGTGPPLVLIHGFSLDTRMWDDQFELLARHYRVLRYDALGFGKSDLPSGEISHTDDLLALLDLVGIAQAHVLGFSMGVWIAVEFALLHPETVSALILVDGILLGYPMGEVGESYALVGAKARASGAQAARELWLDQPLFASAIERPDTAPRLRRIISDYSGWHFAHVAAYRPLDPPAVQRLNEINAPTLIMVGECDLPPIHALADTLQRTVPSARKVILPGVGHMSNMEGPELFNETVLTFLAEVR
jgi:3-oxoadipate enol-lactonase